MSFGIFKLVLLSAINSSVISKVSFTLGADFFFDHKKVFNFKVELDINKKWG